MLSLLQGLDFFDDPTIMSTKSSNTDAATDIGAVLAFAQRGDLKSAIKAAEAALGREADPGAMRALLGLLFHRVGDLDAALTHLRVAAGLKPSDVTIAFNLSVILTEAGAWPELLALCSPHLADIDPSRRLWRLRANALQSLENYAEAVVAYRRVLAAAPGDFESWNNLGNAQAALGDLDASIQSLEQALAIMPDAAPARLNLAATLIGAGRSEDAIDQLEILARRYPNDSKPLLELSGIFKQRGDDAQALYLLKRAVAVDPGDVEAKVKLAVELVVGWDMEQAEAALRAAIAIEPAHAEANVLLGLLLEHTNRADQLSGLIQFAEAGQVADGAVAFLQALALRREKRFEEGLTALYRVAKDIEPVRTAQMRGQFLDRLGDADGAFAAFQEMNAVLASDPTDPNSRAEVYRHALQADRRLVTRDWYAGWRPAIEAAECASPVFLIGFPRSGTTLLDTLLMGHPNVQVLEERPPLTRVEQALGGLEKLPTLTDGELRSLRQVYNDEVDRLISRREDALLVDKFPLHLNKAPLIHRLFPDARFILALRHPCDVVLSCFITNFRLNHAMANFLDLNVTARVYDESFGFWEQCRDTMDMNVHQIRYENVIEDSEAELRPLFNYLGLDWNMNVLDHRKTAIERGVISTASYSQVTEPIYQRAAGRWERYRKHLAPVLPLLDPWVQRYGYSL